MIAFLFSRILKIIINIIIQHPLFIMLVIISIPLYGYETWYLIVSEEHRLRLFENKVLRRISGPNKEAVTGGWRKLDKEKLYNLYTSPHK
jgi:hypothetical protein